MMQITGLKHEVIRREFINRDEFAEKLKLGFGVFDRSDVKVKNIVINADAFQMIRASIHHYDKFSLNIETEIANLNLGILGTLYGARIWASRECSDEEMRFYPENDPQFAKDFPSIAAFSSELD